MARRSLLSNCSPTPFEGFPGAGDKIAPGMSIRVPYSGISKLRHPGDAIPAPTWANVIDGIPSRSTIAAVQRTKTHIKSLAMDTHERNRIPRTWFRAPSVRRRIDTRIRATVGRLRKVNSFQEPLVGHAGERFTHRSRASRGARL